VSSATHEWRSRSGTRIHQRWGISDDAATDAERAGSVHLVAVVVIEPTRPELKDVPAAVAVAQSRGDVGVVVKS